MSDKMSTNSCLNLSFVFLRGVRRAVVVGFAAFGSTAAVRIACRAQARRMSIQISATITPGMVWLS